VVGRRWLQLALATAVAASIAVTVIGLRRDGRAHPPVGGSAIGIDALSLADAAGADIVALTVTPPTPGPVRLQVKIVGIDATDTSATVVAGVSEHGARFTAHLTRCGDGCFTSTASLHTADTWTFTVRTTTPRAPLTVQLTAPIPAPDAQMTLTNAVATMSRLRSVRVREALTGRVGGPVLHTEFRFAAPDRFTYTESGAASASAIVVAHRRFDRDTPTSPWLAGDWGSPEGFSWPHDFYTSFWTPATAVRMLGPTNLRGTPTHIIAFAATKTDAWFRPWIGDTDGLVHRMEMRARSHTMNQDYDSFNRPISIAAPTR
jgi:hypothetical protein